MKLFLTIIVLAIVAASVVWFLMNRGAPDASAPHRFDGSISPPGDADNPLPPGGAAVAGGATGGPAVDPPSTATWATEEAGPGHRDEDGDLPPSETRPNA